MSRRGPLERRNYALPRRVVVLEKGKHLVPACGGWLYAKKNAADLAATTPRRDAIWGAWYRGGETVQVGTTEHYLVLNCPISNKWGEVSP